MSTLGHQITQRLVLSMMVEAQATAVIRSLRADAVPSLLLKGVTLERWLYPDGGRDSGDIDLLVSPATLRAAEMRLRADGFVGKYDGTSPDWAEEHADAWIPVRGGVPVDLHRRLWGMRAPADVVWDALWDSREQIIIGSLAVDTPGAAARALLVALHAAHHGRDHQRPLEDLRRAVGLLDRGTWAAAARLARDLDAREALAAGLDLVEGGTALRLDLGLDYAERRPADSALWTAPPTTAGFLQVLEADGLGERARIVMRELFPTRAFMTTAQRRPGGSSSGLWRAYARRWRSLLRSAPRGLRAARQLRHERGRPGERK